MALWAIKNIADFTAHFSNSGDQRQGVASIDVPTLIAHADPGSLFLPSTAKFLENAIKGSKRVAIGNSHLFSLEEPEQYFREVEAFLSPLIISQ